MAWTTSLVTTLRLLVRLCGAVVGDARTRLAAVDGRVAVAFFLVLRGGSFKHDMSVA